MIAERIGIYYVCTGMHKTTKRILPGSHYVGEFCHSLQMLLSFI